MRRRTAMAMMRKKRMEVEEENEDPLVADDPWARASSASEGVGRRPARTLPAEEAAPGVRRRVPRPVPSSSHDVMWMLASRLGVAFRHARADLYLVESSPVYDEVVSKLAKLLQELGRGLSRAARR